MSMYRCCSQSCHFALCSCNAKSSHHLVEQLSLSVSSRIFPLCSGLFMTSSCQVFAPATDLCTAAVLSQCCLLRVWVCRCHGSIQQQLLQPVSILSSATHHSRGTSHVSLLIVLSGSQAWSNYIWCPGHKYSDSCSSRFMGGISFTVRGLTNFEPTAM